MKKSKLKVNSVGATSSRPHFEGMTIKNQKGITLIALIITIIVMLVLVGVTINVALNGGLFEKGEKAAYQTNLSTIREQLALKKAEILADNNGKAPDDYEIDLSDLQISESVRKEFEGKLAISKDGELYYIDGEVNDKEKAWIKELGITEYVEAQEPVIPGIPGTVEYTLILNQVAKGAYTDMAVIELDVELELSNEQKYEIIEKGLQIEYGNNKSLKENLLDYYNEMAETNFTEFEQLGITVDKAIWEYTEGDSLDEATIAFFYEYSIYSIIRPDGTTYEQFTTKNKGENTGECVYEDNYIEASRESVETCYFAPQLGTYKITATIDGYVATGTITINEF